MEIKIYGQNMQTFRNISLEKMNTSLASTNNLHFLGCAAVGGSMRRMGRDIPSATQKRTHVACIRQGLPIHT